jgi:hypothetical protein
MVRSLRKLFRGRLGRRRRASDPGEERVRLRKREVIDRPPPTKLTVGASTRFPDYQNPNLGPCILVQFEGPGYVDHYVCDSLGQARRYAGWFKCMYPGIAIRYLS